MAEQTLSTAMAPAGAVRSAAGADLLIARMEAVPFTRRHLGIASILGVGALFDSYDAISLALALTVITATFGVGYVNAGLLLASGAFGQFLGSIVFGVVAERQGRKQAFVWALVAFGGLSLVSAASWNVPSLGILRALQGVGLGGLTPVAAALWNEFVGARVRGIAVMLLTTSFGWGFILVPFSAVILFSLLSPQISWRVLFIIGSAPLIVALVAQRWLPESPRWQVDRGRVGEAEATVAGLESAARAAGKAIPQARVTLRADVKPTSWTELFARPYLKRTILSWTLWFTTFFVVADVISWWPTLYVRVGHLPASLAALLQLATGLSTLVWGYLMSLITDRAGRKPLFIFGFLLCIVGAGLGIGLTLANVGSWQLLVVAGLFMLMGAAATNGGLCFVYTPEMFPTRMRAWATATGASMLRLSGIVGAITIGIVLASSAGPAGMFALLLAISLVGLAAIVFLGFETKGRALEELSQ